MSIIGLFGVIAPLIVPPDNREQGAAGCSGCGAILLLIGLPMVLAYFFFYRVAPSQALVDKRGRVELEGWHLGLPPASPTVVSTARTVVEISTVELETPDDGVLSASLTVSYSPDLQNSSALTSFGTSDAINRAIQNRVRGALNSWAMGKPLPGTLKRAVSMQKDAETYLIGKLTGTSSQLVLHDDPTLYLEGGYPVADLGIRLHEINTIVWRPLEAGTGKADWGDGDHVGFDAQAIFKQFHAHTDSLSNLRKLKEALMERYPDEADDIEDIYDQVRISMKENRDR